MLTILIAIGLMQRGQIGGANLDQIYGRGDKPLKLNEVKPVKPLVFGDIEIDAVWNAITRVGVITRAGVDMIPSETYFTVVLRITNRSPTKRFTFKSFDELCSVKDDVGNTYDHVKFGRGSSVKQSADNKVVYPKESLIDVLAFDIPVSAAKKLTLILDGGSIGETKPIEIEFPVASIPKAVEKEVLDATYFLTNPKVAMDRRKGKQPKEKVRKQNKNG